MHPDPSQPPGLGLPTLVLMAVACGLCAGGNYFNQPLLHSIATSFGSGDAAAAFTVTLAQLSYACGLLLLVPLGDMLERRGLIVALTLLAATGQFTAGFAPNLGVFSVGVMLAGLFSVAAQVMVPLAATLSDPRRSGAAVGFVMSGLLVGILSARSVAGLLSEAGGWQTVYRVAGVAMVVLAVALRATLPVSRNAVRQGYVRTLRSLGQLLRDQPRLRTRAALGGLAFGSVSVLFTTMSLLLSGPAFGLGDAQVGLVGLAGVAGALMANVAGRLSDRGWGQQTTAASAGLMVAAWGLLAAGGTNLWLFMAGMLVIDLALQGIHISNQQVIYRLAPEARSRLNAAYMTIYFGGAAAGSALGSFAWQAGGWPAACVLGVGIATLCGPVWFLDQRLARAATAR